MVFHFLCVVWCVSHRERQGIGIELDNLPVHPCQQFDGAGAATAGGLNQLDKAVSAGHGQIKRACQVARKTWVTGDVKHFASVDNDFKVALAATDQGLYTVVCVGRVPGPG